MQRNKISIWAIKIYPKSFHRRKEKTVEKFSTFEFEIRPKSCIASE